MNKKLQDFARSDIKLNLHLCDSNNIKLFKQMYSHTDLDKDLIDIVNDIPPEKLDWVMEQVRSTIIENKKKSGGREPQVD